ncbi:MAG: flagellar basal body rod protein FlgC [Erysipelotrichaceae bacterium]
MSFLNSLNITGSALTAQRVRIETITQNLANVATTRTEDGGPYTRKLVVLEEKQLSFDDVLQQRRSSSKQGGVQVKEIIESDQEFVPVYNPEHPDANEEGYVLMPNVDRTEEQVDLMAATRAYEANITALNVVKTMTMRAMEIGK